MDEIYTRRRRKTNVERIRCHQDMISITQATEGSGDNTLLSSEPCRSPRQSSDLPTTPSETKVTVRTTASAIWRYLRLVLVPWLVVLGIAIGHHAYYQQLDNEIVLSSDQRMWSFRNGSGLAFLVKTGLVIVVGVVAAQQIWATLRRNTVSVRGIDHMFEIMANPLAIFDRDILRHAKIVSVLAIISWFIPLIAVLAPATLSVQSRITTSITQQDIRTVNFIDYLLWANFEGAGWIQGPTYIVEQLFTNVYSSASIVPQSAPFPNAFYNLSFHGPSYRCFKPGEVTSEQTNDRDFEQTVHKALGLDGNGHPSGSGTIYNGSSPSEMSTWIFIYGTGFNQKWSESAPPVIACQLYNTSFALSISFEDGVQLITSRSVKYLEPKMINYTSRLFVAPPSKCPSMGVGCVEGGMVSYMITHMLFSDLLSGELTVAVDGGMNYMEKNHSAPGGSARFLQSSMVNCPEIWNSTDFPYTSWIKVNENKCINGTLAATIEELSRNFTYSTLTFEPWSNYTTTVPMAVTTPRNIYLYDKRAFLTIYSIAFLVTLVCISVYTKLNQIKY